MPQKEAGGCRLEAGGRTEEAGGRRFGPVSHSRSLRTSLFRRGAHVALWLFKASFYLQPPASSLRPPASSLQPPASSLQPPASSLQPPASSLQPPASSLQPPASSLQPPASGLQPPASSLQPPASSLQPPASSLQPPASSLQPPASSLQPPASSLFVVPSPSMAEDDTSTAPTESWLAYRPDGSAREVLALVIVWSLAEPGRLGEVALLPKDGVQRLLGRGGGKPGEEPERITFFRQRPGSSSRGTRWAARASRAGSSSCGRTATSWRSSGSAGARSWSTAWSRTAPRSRRATR